MKKLIYITLVLLLNPQIGSAEIFRKAVAGNQWGRTRLILSILLLAPPVLVYAFFYETPQSSPERSITLIRILRASPGSGR